MIAKSDGTIVNSANNPVSDLSYTDGSLTIMDSEEAKNALFNIDTARATDEAAEAADTESDDEIYTARCY